MGNSVYFTVTVTGDANRYPTWALYGDNHEMVAWAGEGFDSSSNATRAANAFKSGATDARYETFQDVGGSWRWRAWRSSDKVAASGESFDSKYNAERAAENVRANAPYATGP
ncbi:YegP family protein [Mycolicibacterium sp. 018/SC-01/001]|uniref:YegP family protein n=1 Tax=Mycolicibacterium sp. 018/SC-01/001 TaxID=2592069 RepID=UPI00351A20A4